MKKITLLSLLVLAMLFAFSGRLVLADYKMDMSGNLVFYEGQVLGDREEKQNEELKRIQEQTRENEQERMKLPETISPSPLMQRLESQTAPAVPPRLIERERVEKVEIRKPEVEEENETSDSAKVRVRISEKNGAQRESTQQSFQYETPNGKVQIERSKEKTEIQIHHASTEAKLNYPVSIDPTTQELTVNTPEGDKVLTTLPDDAAKSAAEHDSVDSLNTASAKLEMKDGKLQYHFEGVKHKKILGFIPVDLKKDVEVSADTGVVTNVNESILTKALSLISF